MQMRSLIPALVAAVVLAVLPPRRVRGASYIMMPDTELAREAPLIIHGRTLSNRVEVGSDHGRPAPFTVTTLQLIEVLKGSEADTEIRVRVAGGKKGNLVWWVPGAPRFTPGEEDILFLFPLTTSPGEYGLTEFGLSKFEVYTGPDGRRYAGRAIFLTQSELAFAQTTVPEHRNDDYRELPSFLTALRAAGRGEPMPPIRHALPVAAPLKKKVNGGVTPEWVNIGGTENGTDDLFRWFWDTENSPPGVVAISGTEQGIDNGSDGTAEVSEAIAGWTGVAGATVDYSGPSTSGNVNVQLGVTNDPNGDWSTPFCNSGVVGLGGPGPSSTAPSFKGDSPYFAIASGTIEMRQVSTASGCNPLPENIFRSAVLHEMGHSLGLGHPDQATSRHSTTTPAEWDSAVMHSVIPPSIPIRPQPDDIQAIQFYYGSFGSGGGTAPTAGFIYSPASPETGQQVQFSDTSTGTPIAWAWTFGDGGTSTLQNPAHTYSAAGTYTVQLTASNSFGSSRASTTVTVTSPPPPGSPPGAGFLYSPASPETGQQVQFSDTSTGSPTAWAWTFGDGGTSTLQNPAHTYSVAGTYTVQLTASNSFGSSRASQTVTVVSPPSQTRVVTIPGVGHVTGVGGTTFISDVEIENPAAFAVAATLAFVPAGGVSAPPPVVLEFAPNETKVFHDAVATLFNVTNGLGALTLTATALQAPPSLRMTSRTYSQIGAGTYGLSAAAFANAPLSTGPRYVTGIDVDSEFRTNLGAVNTTAGWENFQIVLTTSSGAIAGSSGTLALAPGGQMQWSVAQLFPGVSGEGMTVAFLPAAGSSVPFAYAAVVDNFSTDSTYYPSAVPATNLFLPAIADITGAGNSLFQSEITFANTTPAAVTVTVTFLEHDKDNTTAPIVTLTLAPGGAERLTNALSSLFTRTETYGALQIAATGGIVVASRISTANPLGSGTVGQQVDPVIPAGIAANGALLGLRQDSFFRANVVFLNTATASNAVALALRLPDGQPLATTALTLPPRGYVQRNLTALFPGVSLPAGVYLTLDISSGNAAITAASSVIDNSSQDLTFTPELY